MESSVRGKTYNITKYTNNKCVVKISKKHTPFYPHGHEVRQGCSFSPTLFNIYINELARALKQSATPGLTLLESEVKCLLFADDPPQVNALQRPLLLQQLRLQVSWIFAHSSRQNLFSSFKLDWFHWCTPIFKSYHRFSIGLRSGL